MDGEAIAKLRNRRKKAQENSLLEVLMSLALLRILAAISAIVSDSDLS